MSDAGALDKRRREAGTGLAPDKNEACSDHRTGTNASTVLAALIGGPEMQSCISVTGLRDFRA
jgi:hypothetical protein